MRRSQISVVLATAAVVATATLRAQLPTGDSAFHVAPGSVRDLEEERLRAAAVVSPGWVRVYRIPAPPEMVVKYYRTRLGASSGALPDSTALAPGASTSPRSQMFFYSFQDECMDAADSAAQSGAASTCRAWRRAKDKRRILANALVMTESGWVEGATFTWYYRDPSGELLRQTVKVQDAGLTPNWKRYTLNTRVVFQSAVVQPPAP